jgi:hypothetical protein
VRGVRLRQVACGLTVITHIQQEQHLVVISHPASDEKTTR